ncbi:MAG: hypothetical protein Q8910_11145 [Bacteroidota bacterium]|nr:hypothetical protein [Bacteroidota bacterium]
MAFFFLPVTSAVSFAQVKQKETIKLDYVKAFDNVNHPEICYWFFSENMIKNDRYMNVLDSLAHQSLYTFIFLTARNGVDFYDYDRMRPIFRKIVEKAHSYGIKIGLQLWENRKKVEIENTDRCITEGEVALDENGEASFDARAKHIRKATPLIKSELFKVYAFKKTSEGFYKPGSLKDITSQTSSDSPDKGSVNIKVHAGKAMKGYTAYIMAQHFYNFSSNHGKDASLRFIEAINAYASIPFDGVALDEYTNLRISPPWEIKNELWRERLYSLSMEEAFRKQTGNSLEKALFDMRYAPEGQSSVRAKAINQYMDLMRRGPLNVENAVYQQTKKIFGKNAFAGVHDTHHNALTGDEFWVTGLNWWTVPREYGQTDEHTPLPTQMGIAMSHPMNAMYNMYYNKSLDNIVEKSMDDLRYGIRTHYHAVNDIQGWGVSVEKMDALKKINSVENCARMENRFNPALPEIKLLVIFGMEALSNWYPVDSNRGTYDYNEKLGVEEKAIALWNAGYHNALVPSDLIVNQKIRIDADGKPIMNGHKFDAIVYLYPEYSREPVIKFLETYLAKGGKLMIEGRAKLDFNGNNIEKRYNTIFNKATVGGFSVDKVGLLGITRNEISGGCKNEDGSYTFTDLESVLTDKTTSFQIDIEGDKYEGKYKGIALIMANKAEGLTKFSSAGLKELRKNGKIILSFEKPTGLFITKHNSILSMTIADGDKICKPVINAL